MSDQGKWGYYPLNDVKKLMETLNLRGIRENNLHKALTHYLELSNAQGSDVNSENFKKQFSETETESFN